MECGICYTNTNILKTDCNHLFCSKCLATWREIKNKADKKNMIDEEE